MGGKTSLLKTSWFGHVSFGEEMLKRGHGNYKYPDDYHVEDGADLFLVALSGFFRQNQDK